MASWQVAGVEGAVGSDAGDFLIAWDLVEKLGQHPSPVRSKLVAVTGSTSPTSLVVSLAGWISNVCASISPLGECAIRLPGNGCGSCAVSHVAPLVRETMANAPPGACVLARSSGKQFASHLIPRIKCPLLKPGRFSDPPHRCSRAAGHACQSARPPTSWRDQTRSSATHGD